MINHTDETTINTCCAFMRSDYNYIKSLLIPKTYFDRRDISKNQLQHFIENLANLYEDKYTSKIEEKNSSEITIDKLSNKEELSYLDWENINSEEITVNLRIVINSGRILIAEHNFTNLKIIDIIDLDIAKERFSICIDITDINIHSIETVLRSGNLLYNISVIKNQGLKDFLIKYLSDKTNYISACSIVLTEECKLRNPSIFKKDIIFYNIPIEESSLIEKRYQFRFILLNILRTYYCGYEINLIKIFNSLRLKHKEINSFDEIVYFLFLSQSFDFVYMNYIVSKGEKTKDINSDFRIITINVNRTFKTLSFPSKSNLGNIKTCEQDIFTELTNFYTPEEIEEDDDYDDDYDDNYDNIIETISEEAFLEIHSDLRKNYTKKLLKLLKWI